MSVCVYICMDMASKQTYIHIYMYAYIHAYTVHIYSRYGKKAILHAYIHTYIRAYIHTVGMEKK